MKSWNTLENITLLIYKYAEISLNLNPIEQLSSLKLLLNLQTHVLRIANNLCFDVSFLNEDFVFFDRSVGFRLLNVSSRNSCSLISHWYDLVSRRTYAFHLDFRPISDKTPYRKAPGPQQGSESVESAVKCQEEWSDYLPITTYCCLTVRSRFVRSLKPILIRISLAMASQINTILIAFSPGEDVREGASITHHRTPEFTIVITGDIPRTVHVQPAFFLFPNAKKHLMNTTSFIFRKSLYHFFQVPKEKTMI